MSTHPYIIIGGTTKAATTSLFRYLADHPQVKGSIEKETRFFLDQDYPLPSKYRFEDGLDKYDTFFVQTQKEGFPLEATPDYLYSTNTAEKIKRSLPEVRLIFILREPVDRLISWYRFAKQTGRLSIDVSLDEYVHLQLETGEEHARTPQHLRALEQGRYSCYLRPYLEIFEPHEICIIPYTGLKKAPLTIMEQLCSFIGIDATPYRNYTFEIFNRTENLKSGRLHRIYMECHRRIRLRVMNRPWLRAVIRSIYLQLKPIYIRLNSAPIRNENIVISASLNAFLREYYGSEQSALSQLLGWNNFSWDSTEVWQHRAKH